MRLLDSYIIRKCLRSRLHLDLYQSLECSTIKKVQVGKDQEKTQSEKDSHSKNRGGKK